MGLHVVNGNGYVGARTHRTTGEKGNIVGAEAGQNGKRDTSAKP